MQARLGGTWAHYLIEHKTSRATRYLPQALVATAAVAVLPVVIVWWLRDAGTISSPWVCIALAIALSLAASLLGSAAWKRCRGSGDVFFSELLLWGWLHRFRGERRLARTAGLLGLVGPELEKASGGAGATTANVERKARLLREMAAALDAQDPYTDGHSRRVALHSAMVARKLGLGRDEIAKIRTAAAVHDIGKLRIPPELLNKPGELSDEEFEIVKRHANDGAEIVAGMDDPEITGMVRHHHERFDGGGYPSGLTGEETPVGARVIAVADTFDALTSVRPYRGASSHKRALEAIVAVSGTQLDPAVVRAFLRCYSANRAVLFWTLLAVSPQRAIGWIRGKGAGRANVASTATVATPAVLAAVVATVFSATNSVATIQQPLRVAQRSGDPTTGAVSASHYSSPRPGSSPAGATSTPAAPKQAVLGVSVSRGMLGKHLRAGHVLGTSGGAGTRSGSGAIGGSGGGGKNPGSSAGHGRGGGSTATTFVPPASGSGPPLAVTAPATSPYAPSAPTSSGTPVAAGGGSTSSGSGPGGPGTSGGTGSPGGGGSNGASGGNQGNSGGSSSGGNPGGSGGGSGGGNGSSGGGGSPGPPNKDACKNDGYSGYGFSNQGQCVAYAEHQSSH